MFGRHKLTGEAQAKVMAINTTGHFMIESGGYHYSKYDLILDVAPQGQPMFRAETVARFPIFFSPSEGDILNVRFDLETHEVEVDIDSDPRYNVKLHDKAQKAAEQAKREQLLAGQPGTSPQQQRGAWVPTSPGAVPLDPELQELMDLEEQERRKGGGGFPPPR